jgi:hypothetical protein
MLPGLRMNATRIPANAHRMTTRERSGHSAGSFTSPGTFLD